MKRKTIIFITSMIVIFLISMVTTIKIVRNQKNKEISKNENNIENRKKDELVTDECTEEYEYDIAMLSKEANSADERLGVNAKMVLKKYYSACEHTINEYAEIPKEIVNMTEEEIKEEYPEWEIIGFIPEEVILYKEFPGNCNEHYFLKIEDEVVAVYRILDSGEMQLEEKTDIAAEYLSETDLIKINDGIIIYGKEELNQILEDFE